MPEELSLRLRSELLPDLHVLALVVLPELEILQNLDSLDLAVWKSLFEDVFNFLERLGSYLHVIGRKVELLDSLSSRVDPVIWQVEAVDIADDRNQLLQGWSEVLTLDQERRMGCKAVLLDVHIVLHTYLVLELLQYICG